MREWVLYFVGLVVGVMNAVRHRVQGYTTPRRFSSSDYALAAPYDRKVVRRWSLYGAEFKDRRVLEIGPGPDLGTGALMLAAGASSYLAVDVFPLAANVPATFYESLGANPSDLRYLPQPYPDLPLLDEEFDLVVSNASLEHVDDVPRLFERLAEVVVPGGMMVHYIDAKTHTRWLTDHDPLNVYRFGHQVYRAMSFPGMLNRLLAEDYVAAAELAGFEAHAELGKLAPPRYLERVRLAPAFRGRSDLDFLSFALVARRR